MTPDLRVLPAALLMGALLTACGGEGPIDIPSPTGSITASAPSPTRSPSRSDRPEASETPTEPENPDETSEQPTESPSEKPPKNEQDETDTPSSTPADETTEATDPAEEDGLPSWFWWVVVGLGLLGAAWAAILIPRARRRRAWDADLMSVRTDVTWFAQDLIPTLQQAASPDEVAGGWNFAVGRVTGAEDQLTVLEANAPDEARESQARTLRDAVRDAAQKMEDLLVLRDPTTLARDLAAIQTQLAAALHPTAGI